jgi:transaldolase/glucose-6-phosphate isomerase
LFAGHRWEALEASGAKTQRLLWASTGVKDPAYKDTKYVEALIGRDTVNTIPPATMDAFRHHGMVMPDAVEGDLDSAHTILAELEQIGVSLNEVTDELLKDGVRKFAGAFDKLLDSIARRRDVLRESEPAPRQVSQAHRK